MQHVIEFVVDKRLKKKKIFKKIETIPVVRFLPICDIFQTFAYVYTIATKLVVLVSHVGSCVVRSVVAVNTQILPTKNH